MSEEHVPYKVNSPVPPPTAVPLANQAPLAAGATPAGGEFLPPVHPQCRVFDFKALLVRVQQLHENGEPGHAEDLLTALCRATKQTILMKDTPHGVGFFFEDHKIGVRATEARWS